MNSQERVVVTGMGAITPIGLSVDAFWKAMGRGESGAVPLTRFDASSFKTRFACELKGFDPLNYMDRKQAKRLDRFCQYALAATSEAINDAALTDWPQDERDAVGVVFGSGIGGLQVLETQSKVLLEKGANSLSPFMIPMMIGNMASGMIAMQYGLKGPNHGVVSACSTGNDAIRDAVLLLRQGHANVIVCGGSEAPITPLGVGGFATMRALSTRNDTPETASRPFDATRDGFVLGEGAGALVLETLSHAQIRGAKIYAEVLGFGASSDAYHYAAPDPSGAGVILALKRALQDAQITPDKVDHINMHATSTPLGDVAESNAIKQVFGTHAYQMQLSATKSMTGHLLGAAGAIEAISTILATQYNVVPPTINVESLDPDCDLNYTVGKPHSCDVNIALSNAFGFGGHNTTIVFGKFSSTI
ncbi:beta-ketoacyl-ACP synthase II [Leptothoe sp. ISB3NOV94-8A]|uniref:3-oxoacyl-[acyl-carrier-protein] synthase 2 n=1 Tax=Adonisia turfae CCMR0081 TaxID=2292702 RepID=A0A6M0RQ15_9CYAN|nr:beta-ketoacyl-ACP synthase II [Adonisia turfae]NEZ57960.1 beta-ketoacyl-[acyl-carrier-protein] synthase II [Adonisia turfae CCMR0081]